MTMPNLEALIDEQAEVVRGSTSGCLTLMCGIFLICLSVNALEACFWMWCWDAVVVPHVQWPMLSFAPALGLTLLLNYLTFCWATHRRWH